MGIILQFIVGTGFLGVISLTVHYWPRDRRMAWTCIGAAAFYASVIILLFSIASLTT